MEIVLLCARLLLAVVFGVAGISKLADIDGSHRAMIGFGIPEKIAGPSSWLLPAVELLIALSLIPLSSAWAGAVGATGVLLIFTVGISANLARGRRPDCHCFGQLHSEPLGWSTLARNIVLMGIAVFIVGQGKDNTGLSALSWLNDLKVVECLGLALGVTSVALIAITFAYLRRLLKQYSSLVGKIDAMKKVIDEDYAEAPLERLDAAAPKEGLPIGAPAPEFSLSTIGAERVQLGDLLAHDKSVVLLFVSPNCFPCEALFPLIKDWESEFRNRLTLALVSKGSMQDNRRLVEKHKATHVLVQNGSTTADEYRVNWTPAAVVISRSGRIASQVAYGDDAIRALIAKAGASRDVRGISGNGASGNGHGVPIGEHSSLKVGDLVPDFTISDLDGRMIKPSDFRGRDTLLLFWDPGCPFCAKISDDLARWEETSMQNTPRLVFVASGDAEKIEAESKRFTSLYLHDVELKVAPMFGTSSTPSAVLISGDGRIASVVAIGLPNALAMLGIRKVELPIASVN